MRKSAFPQRLDITGKMMNKSPKKMKILGLPSDDGACGHYRVIWPLRALQDAGLVDMYVPPIVDGDRFVKLSEEGIKDPSDPNLVNNYSMIVLQRQPQADVLRLINGAKALGILTIFDIDDSAITIPVSNPNYMVWGKDKRKIRSMVTAYIKSGNVPKAIRGRSIDDVVASATGLRDSLLNNIRAADMVTVTTPSLKEDYSRYNNNIVMLPNQMRLNLWKDLEYIPHDGRIWVGWAGGWTHYEDLKLIKTAMREVIRRHDNADLVLIGFDQAKDLVFDDIPPDRVVTFPWSKDLKGYRKYVNSLDICLAPSYDNRFNEGKSDIRCLEAWCCKVPVVGSFTTYGHTIKESGGGLVAKRPKDWIKGMGRLITNVSLRKSMGIAGYNYTSRKRTYRATTHLWMSAYSSLFDGG